MPVTISDPSGGIIAVTTESAAVRVTGSGLTIAVNTLATEVEVHGTGTGDPFTKWAFCNVHFRGNTHPELEPPQSNVPSPTAVRMETGKFNLFINVLRGGYYWELRFTHAIGTSVQRIEWSQPNIPPTGTSMLFYFNILNSSGAYFDTSDTITLEFWYR